MTSHKHQVLRLDVSVHISTLMHVLDSLHNAFHMFLYSSLSKALSISSQLSDSFSQVNVASLHDEVKGPCVIDRFVEFDDVWMADILEKLHLYLSLSISHRFILPFELLHGSCWSELAMRR